MSDPACKVVTLCHGVMVSLFHGVMSLVMAHVEMRSKTATGITTDVVQRRSRRWRRKRH